MSYLDGVVVAAFAAIDVLVLVVAILALGGLADLLDISAIKIGCESEISIEKRRRG